MVTIVLMVVIVAGITGKLSVAVVVVVDAVIFLGMVIVAVYAVSVLEQLVDVLAGVAVAVGPRDKE